MVRITNEMSNFSEIELISYYPFIIQHAAETSEGMISDFKKMGATFRRLVAAGVDVNATDNDGKNALYYAVQV